jgi:hypothetical protein
MGGHERTRLVCIQCDGNHTIKCPACNGSGDKLVTATGGLKVAHKVLMCVTLLAQDVMAKG